MKKILSLSFVLLGLATATAFAAPTSADTSVAGPTQVTSVKGKHQKVAKKGHKKHKKHKKKPGQ